MDEMEHFVIENNVSMFFSQLAREPEVRQRAMLSRLLLEEEDRYAKLSSHLDSLESYIAKCDVQIARHRAFLADDSRSEDQRQLTRMVLANIVAIKETLQSALATGTRRLEGLDGP